MMRTIFVSIVAILPLMAGCGGSFPEPKQRMADAESAARSAREVGSDMQPNARLQVKLADEQLAAAKALVAAGDMQRADHVLMRAQADAELGLALAREQNASVEVQKAVEKSKLTRSNDTKVVTP
jgi:hypothetical protein